MSQRFCVFVSLFDLCALFVRGFVFCQHSETFNRASLNGPDRLCSAFVKYFVMTGADNKIYNISRACGSVLSDFMPPHRDFCI